jgi:hypothetical protein
MLYGRGGALPSTSEMISERQRVIFFTGVSLGLRAGARGVEEDSAGSVVVLTGRGDVFRGGIQLTDFLPNERRDLSGDGILSSSSFSEEEASSIRSTAWRDIALEDEESIFEEDGWRA